MILYRSEDSKTNKKWTQELLILRKNFRGLDLKVMQLVPVCSRSKKFKWFALKDKYSYVTFVLVRFKEVNDIFVLNFHKNICEMIRDNEKVLMSDTVANKVGLGVINVSGVFV